MEIRQIAKKFLSFKIVKTEEELKAEKSLVLESLVVV